MECFEIKENLSLYIDQMLDDTQMKEISEHLSCCEACRQDYEILLTNINLLKSIPEIALPSDFDLELRSALNNAKTLPIYKRFNWKAYSLAAAVFLLMIVSVSANFLNQKDNMLQMNTASINDSYKAPNESQLKSDTKPGASQRETASLESNVYFDTNIKDKSTDKNQSKTIETQNKVKTQAPVEQPKQYKSAATPENNKLYGFAAMTRGNLSVKTEDELKQIANEVMETFVKGINENNSNLLISCMSPQSKGYYAAERADAALEDYHSFFNSKKASFDFVEYNQNDHILIYKISAGDKEKEAKIYMNDESCYVGELCLTYSYWVHKKMDSFIDALKTKDVIKLAGAYGADDLYCPASEAEKVLKIYANAYDLGTIKYIFTGFSDNSTFSFKITGTKNNQTVEHSVSVICGDGSAGLIDGWAKVELKTQQ